MIKYYNIHIISIIFAIHIKKKRLQNQDDNVIARLPTTLT